MLDFSQQGEVALLRLDDGKANAVSHAFVDAVHEGLDRSEKEAKAVVITGRAGVFSAGFDLKEFEKGQEATLALVDKGARMLLRIFSHPQPVVVACSGHAIAAGAFTLLAADTRIGARGEFKIGLNETAIGMSLPVFGLELAKSRLSKRAQTAAVIQATLYGPEQAQKVGFLDELVSPEEVVDTALERARALAEYPGQAYAANKIGIRADAIEAIRASLA
ncbi:MAG: crotonase/enoyl-CoA hydratase family protein [Myxococcales bacterium]|nr:crotonase/enoyl-CoA hydratase family protein [Myxococcales bacterium]